MQNLDVASNNKEDLNISAGDSLTLSRAYSILTGHFFVFAMVLISGLGMTALVATTSYISDRSVVRYFIEFTSIKNGLYPNGTIFSTRDLVSPDVLMQIQSKFGIKSYQNLVKGVLAIADSPFLPIVNKKYTDQLTQSKLTTAELSNIDLNFKTDVNTLVSRGVSIIVNAKDLEVDVAKAKLIALEIPKIWNEVTINKYNVTNDNALTAASIPVSNVDFSNSLNVFKVDKYIDNISHGLGTVERDGRLQLIKLDNGLTVADLRSQLTRFTNIFFFPIFSFYNKKDDMIYNSYLDEIKLSIDEVNTKIANIDVIIEDIKVQRNAYNTNIGSSSFSNTIEPNYSSRSRSGAGDGDRGFDALINLVNKAAMSDYLKETFEQRSGLVALKASLQKKYDRIANTPLNANHEITNDFRAIAEAEFLSISTSYHKLIESCRAKLNTNLLNFYTPVSAPETSNNFKTLYPVLILGTTMTFLVIILLVFGYFYIEPKKYNKFIKI